MNISKVALALIQTAWRWSKVDLLPKLSIRGVGDYFAVAIGLALGFAIFAAPMKSLQDGFRKNGGA